MVKLLLVKGLDLYNFDLFSKTYYSLGVLSSVLCLSVGAFPRLSPTLSPPRPGPERSHPLSSTPQLVPAPGMELRFLHKRVTINQCIRGPINSPLLLLAVKLLRHLEGLLLMET